MSGISEYREGGGVGEEDRGKKGMGGEERGWGNGRVFGLYFLPWGGAVFGVERGGTGCGVGKREGGGDDVVWRWDNFGLELSFSFLEKNRKTGGQKRRLKITELISLGERGLVTNVKINKKKNTKKTNKKKKQKK